MAIGPNVIIKAWPPAKTEMFRLQRCHDKARTMERHAPRTKSRVRRQRLHGSHINPDGQVRVDMPSLAGKFDVRLIRVEPVLSNNLTQHPFTPPGSPDGHRNTHRRRLVGRLGPGMIGDGHQ